RIRAGYVAGNPSKLEILLNSKDMTVLFYNIELLKQLSKRDEELIDKLKGETDELKTIKSNMEKDKADLTTTKKELDKKLADLKSKKADQDAQARSLNSAKDAANSKITQARDAVNQLNKNSAAYKAQLAKLQKEREEADRLIDAYIAQHGSSSGSPKDEGNEGDFKFPLPYSSCYFSALYGTYPGGGAHYGLDMCVSGGTMGKNIVAAQGGKVITAGWNNSYGNYVVLDHGAGMFTLYAHCSRLVVSAGQSVNKGQKLAEAGSTGNSTGPHLHFEVRLNKNGSVTRINPLPYFPGKPNSVGVTFSGL
ncbi:MAG TPA: peptidoglycan DD-metalloendopeptidase family protein, partial [Oscillospiraceae bacterium]|nr:peptidoglycan DD-metalloendopeptidase family protein [Oscillospiraceae bacterium]